MRRRPPARCWYSRPSCEIGQPRQQLKKTMGVGCSRAGRSAAPALVMWRGRTPCSAAACSTAPPPQGSRLPLAGMARTAPTWGQKQKFKQSTTSKYWATSSGRASSQKCRRRSNAAGDRRGAAPASDAASRWMPAGRTAVGELGAQMRSLPAAGRWRRRQRQQRRQQRQQRRRRQGGRRFCPANRFLRPHNHPDR